jgi:hypothetical protein
VNKLILGETGERPTIHLDLAKLWFPEYLANLPFEGDARVSRLLNKVVSLAVKRARRCLLGIVRRELVPICKPNIRAVLRLKHPLVS